jgi:hypothetical protein
MDRKLRPYILITTLVLILIFILGVRYGQNVEKANKKINFMISIPPPKPVPTEKPIEFKNYQSKGCNLEFLYPSTLLILNESTNSATLGKDKIAYLKFSCERLSPTPIDLKDKVATASFRIKRLLRKLQRKTD